MTCIINQFDYSAGTSGPPRCNSGGKLKSVKAIKHKSAGDVKTPKKSVLVVVSM